MTKIQANSTSTWTGLMMVGSARNASCNSLGDALELFAMPSQGASLAHAGIFYVCAFLFAIMSSVLGTWAWNKATRNLPMVLSGRQITLESLFAILFGLLFEEQGPRNRDAPRPIGFVHRVRNRKTIIPLRKLIHIVKWRQGCIVESSRGFYIAGANLPHHIIKEAKTSRICRQGMDQMTS